MIIPFTGACPIRQYCPGKPNPTGIKAFVLANPNGLVCDIEVYQGKKMLPTTGNSLAEEIVLTLTRTLVPGHILYFDRYFTTLRLAKLLNDKGFKCVGTIMRNRVPRDVTLDLKNDKELAREGRGSHDVLVGSNSELALTKWFDNKPILFLSTQYAAEQVDQCRRYDRKIRQYIQVPRPEVVKEYNSHMGGVDLTDRMLAVCPARMRTNKWTVRFILHFVDLAVSNSWIKYKKEKLLLNVPRHKIMQMREFKRVLGEHFIESGLNENDPITGDNNEVHKRGRPPMEPIPSKARRVHGTDHLPEMVTTQRRCRNKGCDKKTSVMCVGCNLYLCLTTKRNCYKKFHTEANF